MTDQFLTSLNIMWNGMFGIFSVTILLTFLIIIFQWCEKKFSKPDKKESE